MLLQVTRAMDDIQKARMARGAKRATIHDVAAQAEVSIKTVSRVLNKEPNVREVTRERVLEAARSLNYEPHPLARGLAGKRTYSLGLLYENPLEFSYVQKALEGVFEACRARGLSLLLRPCPESVGIDDLCQFVRQTRVDGVVLLAPLGDRLELIEMLQELETPLAQVSPESNIPGVIAVSPNDREACVLLTEHVLSHGHRRIGFIQGDPRHGASHKRLRGYLQCLRGHDLIPDKRLITEGSFTFDSGKHGAHKLLREKRKPTAIIASNDDMAAGVIVAARELGLEVPGDLSVVGFDDSPIASHTWPPLTTVRQPISDMASAATVQLIDQVTGKADATMHRVFDCELVVRASLCAPRIA